MRLINSTTNGQIFMCRCHNVVHIEFGNILLKMNTEELEKFTEYVNSVDYKYYLQKNKNSRNRRKLLLTLSFNRVFFKISQSEFLELRELLFLKKTGTAIISPDIISKDISFN